MILTFHMLPLARGSVLCDIDRVWFGVTQKNFKIIVLYNNNTFLALGKYIIGINTQVSYHKLIQFCIQSVDRLI